MTRTRTSAQNDAAPPTISPYRRGSFVRTVYVSAFALTAMASAALAFYRVWGGLSFLSGALVALACFWLLEQTLSWIYQSTRRNKQRMAIAALFGKYTGFGVLLYFLVRVEEVAMIFFAVGLMVIYFAVVLALVIQAFTRRLAARTS